MPMPQSLKMMYGYLLHFERKNPTGLPVGAVRIMPLEIVRNDITEMQVDAIVNTANPRPIVGGI